MKKITYLLSVVILFQSCYSYKTLYVKDYNKTNNKKVRIELIDSTKYKGRIINYNNDIFVIEKNNKIVEFHISEIKTIKQRKVSTIKTLGAITFSILVFYVALNELLNQFIKFI